MLRTGIYHATLYTAAGCPATAPTVRSTSVIYIRGVEQSTVRYYILTAWLARWLGNRLPRSNSLCDPQIVVSGLGVMGYIIVSAYMRRIRIHSVFQHFKSLTANRKLLKANPPLTSVTGDHHSVQCVKHRKVNKNANTISACIPFTATEAYIVKFLKPIFKLFLDCMKKFLQHISDIDKHENS
ncbi:hypothetical protein SFRURICE_003193 [Spodoptera frugiperda]|nr:hypothetical protein SFRURICE_003193 [Spodoptera frugiperda]